eukprot:1859558-Ditylum_brightwellii.AAC.2
MSILIFLDCGQAGSQMIQRAVQSSGLVNSKKKKSSSTMEAECITLILDMTYLFPFQYMRKDIVQRFYFQKGDTIIKSKVWEDNFNALIMGSMEPGKFAPRSKYFRIKYYWFCSKLKPNDIKLLTVDSAKNNSNIMTKS